MKFLTMSFAFLCAAAAFASESYISDVSLKVDGANTSPQVQCFVNEALTQAFGDYELSLIAYSAIDKAKLPEDSNLNASIHFHAKNKETGMVENFVITLSAEGQLGKWNYVQGEESQYPFSAKVSELATAGKKKSGEAPSYVLLTNCK